MKRKGEDRKPLYAVARGVDGIDIAKLGSDNWIEEPEYPAIGAAKAPQRGEIEERCDPIEKLEGKTVDNL